MSLRKGKHCGQYFKGYIHDLVLMTSFPFNIFFISDLARSGKTKILQALNSMAIAWVQAK